MTNNFILSLIFSLVIFFGVYKDDNGNNAQVATVLVEQNLVHLSGEGQHTTASAWSLFNSLKQIKIHIIYQTENENHTCFSRKSIHQTSKGFTVRYCCVKRLLSILYTAFFMLILYRFADPIPACCKGVVFFGKFRRLSTPNSQQSM
jgi:hypothetical protein